MVADSVGDAVSVELGVSVRVADGEAVSVDVSVEVTVSLFV